MREVVINDAPSQTRYNLTKRPVQDDIARRTNTLIVTRGRYYPPGVPQDEIEPPLRLKILPGGNLPPVSPAALTRVAKEASAYIESCCICWPMGNHTHGPAGMILSEC